MRSKSRGFCGIFALVLVCKSCFWQVRRKATQCTLGWLAFLFVQVIQLYFYPVDMRSKYNMGKTGRVKYSWSKWEDERLPGLKGLERAPSLAGVEHRTSGPHRRAQGLACNQIRTQFGFCFNIWPLCFSLSTSFSIAFSSDAPFDFFLKLLSMQFWYAHGNNPFTQRHYTMVKTISLTVFTRPRLWSLDLGTDPGLFSGICPNAQVVRAEASCPPAQISGPWRWRPVHWDKKTLQLDNIQPRWGWTSRVY